MTDRSSFGYYGGRGSPFSNLAESAPRNISDHVEYLSNDYDLYARSPARQTFANPDYNYPELDDNDPNAPDRIHVRYMATGFPIDFPAYSINEEKTYVEDLRRRVADKLRVDPRQVQLIYKGREMKRNQSPLKRYKLKQNSEVAVVITDRPFDYNAGDSNSESGSDGGTNAARNSSTNPRRQRPRSHSTIRFRSDEKVPVLETNGGGFLHPNGHVPSTPVERRHRADSLRPPPDQATYIDRDQDTRDRYRGREREPSRDPPRRREASRDPPRRREPSREPPRRRDPSPAPPQAAPTKAPPADANTPLGKVQALAHTFYTQLLPDATRFLLSGPSDAAARDKQFLKLSETIMAQIVLKADGIETEGNVDARLERKSLVTEANKVLKELDAHRYS